MATKTCRRLGWMLVALLYLATVPRVCSASSSSQFNVTDLGSSYTLQSDPTGTVQTVTSASGQVFSFDKSPVTPIDQVTQSGDGVYKTTLTLQNGTHQIGYVTGIYSGPGLTMSAPSISWILGDWAVGGAYSPVADLNSSGEFVGKAYAMSTYGELGDSFAAFSTPTGQLHGGGLIIPGATLADRVYPDDLNNYINSNLGIYLTSALQVDDLGRIIAEGTLNGQDQYFLLTPAGISSLPAPAPEPATMITMVVGVAAIALRRLQRRSKTAA